MLYDVRAYAERIDELVTIDKVPKGRKKYGMVPVNPEAAEKTDVVLIGCDAGTNGSDLCDLSKIVEEIYRSGSDPGDLFGILDLVSARMALRLIKIGIDEGTSNGKDGSGNY
jgi:hypothetical protein